MQNSKSKLLQDLEEVGIWVRAHPWRTALLLGVLLLANIVAWYVRPISEFLWLIP